jgi:hypothetical protein
VVTCREQVTYRGKHCVKLIEHYEQTVDGQAIAMISGSVFGDGVIEAEIALRVGSGTDAYFSQVVVKRVWTSEDRIGSGPLPAP